MRRRRSAPAAACRSRCRGWHSPGRAPPRRSRRRARARRRRGRGACARETPFRWRPAGRAQQAGCQGAVSPLAIERARPRLAARPGARAGPRGGEGSDLPSHGKVFPRGESPRSTSGLPVQDVERSCTDRPPIDDHVHRVAAGEVLFGRTSSSRAPRSARAGACWPCCSRSPLRRVGVAPGGRPSAASTATRGARPYPRSASAFGSHRFSALPSACSTSFRCSGEASSSQRFAVRIDRSGCTLPRSSRSFATLRRTTLRPLVLRAHRRVEVLQSALGHERRVRQAEEGSHADADQLVGRELGAERREEDLDRLGMGRSGWVAELFSTARGVVTQAGFEPATSCSGGKRSIQLSYWARVVGRTGLEPVTSAV